MRVFLVVLVLGVVAVSAIHQHKNLHDDAHEHWRAFVAKYNKNYKDDHEAAARFSVFKKNLVKIDNLNKQDPHASFAINKFADLSSEEMSGRYRMTNFKPAYSDALYAPLQASAIPDSYDWRTQSKAITPVKDQGQCGSCWAFSATEEIESQWILKGNKAVNLAPQQIVDCDKSDGGCSGGDTPTAYAYVIKAGGIEAEADYPYKAKDQNCSFVSSKAAAKISGWQYVVTKKNETEMLGALAAAPLSICVDASTWDAYESGVITTKCAHNLDHCVQAVGYGTDAATGLKYWNVRNSWGTDWGEGGYIRIERNQGNLCGIASEVTIAVI